MSTISRFYDIDPDDPDSPQVLAEYNGIRPGDAVAYENPAWRQPDGSYKTGGMDGPLTITEIIDLGTISGEPSDCAGRVQVVLNDGEWEVSAANLRKLEDGP